MCMRKSLAINRRAFPFRTLDDFFTPALGLLIGRQPIPLTIACHSTENSGDVSIA
jgi:hypothetical protein